MLELCRRALVVCLALLAGTAVRADDPMFVARTVWGKEVRGVIEVMDRNVHGDNRSGRHGGQHARQPGQGKEGARRSREKEAQIARMI